MTCEQCGADAVGADGICRRCGARAAGRAPQGSAGGGPASASGAGAPTQGETRAADLVVARKPPLPLPRGTATSGAPAPYGQPGAPSSRPSRPPIRPAGATSTAHYCGSCGARLVPGEQFCGQCGTPVFVAEPPEGTAFGRTPFTPSPYGDDQGDGWGEGAYPDDYNAPTEEYSDLPSRGRAGYGSGGYPGAFRGSYSGAYPSGYAGDPRDGHMSSSDRRLLTVFGIVCLAGAVISGVGAVYLALVK
jgi:hypothetical protein